MHAGDRQSKYMPPYSGLLHSLGFLGVISRLRLGSLPCLVCCMLRFACAHGGSGYGSVMTPPRYLHLSICFYFFQLCLPPRFHPPRRAHGHQRIWRGSRCGNRRGHYMQFWCIYCGLRLRPRPLFWFWACRCCCFDDGDAVFFHQGVASRKRGANGKPIREYPPPLMACKWPSGRKLWPPYLTEVVSHGPNLWTS